MKRVTLLLLTVLLLTSCRGMSKTPAPLGADAPADKIPNIIGEYALNATDATGEQYGGTLFINAGDKPNEYKFQWLISGGIQEGVGTLEGNHVTVNWHSVDTGVSNKLSGTASYTITVNGELYGERSIDGMETPGKEAAYPNPK